MNQAMKNFAVFIHPQFSMHEGIFDLLLQLQAEYQIVFWGTAEQRLHLPNWISCCDFSKASTVKIDCILVFGGDGTILRAKDMALNTEAPLLGVNLGYLGFLSETTLSELRASITNLLSQKFKLLRRMLIECQVKRNGSIIGTRVALNDAVIYKAETPRLIHVRIYNNKRYVLDTRCDGVVASTPTGSTAYSLSAGGPILSPAMKAIIIAPLNPHILSIRPMVFGADENISMRVYGMEEPAWLQIDGENVELLREGDEIKLRGSERYVSFIKLSNRTFFQILRNKLHLGR